MTPVSIPTLDALAADPALACDLPPETAEALMCRALAVQTALWTRCLTARTHTGPAEPDSLLDVDAAAKRLNVSTNWIYRRVDKLPFVVRAGRLLRCSSRGIDEYIRRRQGR